MSLRQKIISLEKFSGRDSEENMIAGECSEIEDLKRIAFNLKESPLLSILQVRKNMTAKFWSFVNSSNAIDIDTEVRKI